jgi:hypothetical protein
MFNKQKQHPTILNVMPKLKFNKTVKKYLASYVDETTLNWDEFLPALMLAYNTSYHSTIATTPFELLFGVRPRLPSLPAPEIQRVQYGESFPAERLQLLQHARQVAHQHAEAQGIKYKQNFESTTAPHSFKLDQKVWLSDTTALGKNPKLTPKWLGPYKIVDLNHNNAKLEIKTNKFKIVNCSRLKPFLENKNTAVCPEENRLPQGDPGLFQDTNTDFPNRPLTIALKKSIDYKNAATMAISLLQEDFECPYTFTKNYTQFCCDNCYKAFKKMDFSNTPNICEKHRNLINFSQKTKARANSHCALIKNTKYCKNDVDQTKNDADQIKISAIKEELRLKLTSIASKLLSSEHFPFWNLSEEEQHLWRQFDKEEVYKFITGEEDTLPEFQYDWIEPCQLAVHLPPELQRSPFHKPNKQQLHQFLWLHHCQFRITKMSLVQVNCKQALILTISDPRRRLTTRSCTRESSKDVASSDVRPRSWSQSWLQGLSRQNSLLRILLPTKDNHPNHRSPLVFSPSNFYVQFSIKTTHSNRLHFFTTCQTSTSFPAHGSLRGFHFHQPREDPLRLLCSSQTPGPNDRAYGSLHSRPRSL